MVFLGKRYLLKKITVDRRLSFLEILTSTDNLVTYSSFVLFVCLFFKRNFPYTEVGENVLFIGLSWYYMWHCLSLPFCTQMRCKFSSPFGFADTFPKKVGVTQIILFLPSQSRNSAPYKASWPQEREKWNVNCLPSYHSLHLFLATFG